MAFVAGLIVAFLVMGIVLLVTCLIWRSRARDAQKRIIIREQEGSSVMYDGPSSYPVHAPSNDPSLGSPEIRSAKAM